MEPTFGREVVTRMSQRRNTQKPTKRVGVTGLGEKCDRQELSSPFSRTIGAAQCKFSIAHQHRLTFQHNAEALLDSSLDQGTVRQKLRT